MLNIKFPPEGPCHQSINITLKQTTVFILVGRVWFEAAINSISPAYFNTIINDIIKVIHVHNNNNNRGPRTLPWITLLVTCFPEGRDD